MTFFIIAGGLWVATTRDNSVARLEVEYIKPQEEAQHIFDLCQNSSRQSGCYSVQFSQLTQKTGFEYAIKALDELYLLDPLAKDCHIIAHKIAIAEVEKDPPAWQTLLQSKYFNLCGMGFMHGVLEGARRFDPTLHFDARLIADMCGKIQEGSLLQYDASTNCAHISGHLLLVEIYPNIREAVAICDKVQPPMQMDCYSGIFMESFMRQNLAAHGLAKLVELNEQTAENHKRLCERYEGNSAFACWREMPQIYVNLAQADPRLMWKLCTTNVPQPYTDECYIKGVGVLIGDPALDRRNLSLLCAPYEEKKQLMTRCIDQALHWVLLTSNKLTELTIEFCTAIPFSYQTLCYSTLGQRLIPVAPTQAERIILCTTAPQQYSGLCAAL